MFRFLRFLAAAAIGLTPVLAVAPAQAADPVRVDFYDPGICANQRVLGNIAGRFRHQVRNVPGLPQVAIVDFFQVRENLYLPQHEDRPVDRRYCEATVALSDGYSREVWYLIEKPMGFAGTGSNVEFCVDGFDRWNVYNGRCRVLRPAAW